MKKSSTENEREFYIVWSALFGRNKELNINGKLGGWDWEAVDTVVRMHRIKGKDTGMPTPCFRRAGGAIILRRALVHQRAPRSAPG